MECASKSGRSPSRPVATRGARDGGAQRPAGWTVALGALLLFISLGASAFLSYKHLTGRALAGCGPGSACDALAASAWGRVPWIEWPVAHVGTAYFAGMLTAWVCARGRLGRGMRGVIRLGAGVSAMYATVMIVDQKFCPYCVWT